MNKKKFFFDIRKERKNFFKLAQYALEGYGIWFTCGGVYGTGATTPEIMETLIGPIKKYLLEIYYTKINPVPQKNLKSLQIRKFSEKPPIMLVSYNYLSRVVDFIWLKEKYQFKTVIKAREMIKKIYDNMLLHIILPLNKNYYDLFPFNKDNLSGNIVPSAGFMCLGGYPPLLEFIKIYEKIAPKILKDLPWPFMGTSLTHKEQEPVITSLQARRYFQELDSKFKKSIIVIEDHLMDQIIDKEWKKGGSQSLLDFVNGEGNRVLALRRGTAIPDLVRDILKKYKIVLSYLKNFEDLYPGDEPPISNINKMREFIERIKF